jgi:hypothetical protein
MMKTRVKQAFALIALYILLNISGMTWNTLTNLASGQLVTETHMDDIRENIEHLGDNVLIGGVDAKTLTTTTSAARLATGTYTGDGNATQSVTGVGFQADVLYITHETAAGEQTYYKTDQNTNSIDIGSPASANNGAADQIVSLDADGFTVGDGTGTANAVNVNTRVYTFIAWIA